MLILENIGMTFAAGTPDENTALQGINLSVNKGDFITVIGSNGAGKSTLYNVIAGTITPTAGRILLETAQVSQYQKDEKPAQAAANAKPAGKAVQSESDGTVASPILRDITRDREYKRAHYIGRIFQNPLLGTAGKMSLEDNMMICSRKGYKGLKISLNNKMRDYFKSRLEELNMGLENRLHDNVEQFSGGQRQALTLLMAVMSKPALMLLDEHTAALDPANADIVMNLTLKFAKEYGLTVMMITHNMNHALEYGSRLLMMDSGNIILDIGSEEKSQLTLDDLIERFRSIKNQNFANDRILLQ